MIQLDEGLERQLPINPLQRVPPSPPQSPITNVAVPIQDGLITDDEETGDQIVPLAVAVHTAEQGR